MKVGIVAPIVALEKYCSLSPVQYCYSTLLSQSEKYYDYYRSRVAVGNIVILDFSPAIPRKFFDPDLLGKVAIDIKPTALVLPSCDYSMDRTLSWVYTFLERYSNLECKFIGVIQGVDKHSIKKCYREIYDSSSWIGLPSVLEKIDRRDKLVDYLEIDKPVVYIEVYANPIEEYPRDIRVTYFCSSYPIRLAYSLRKLNEPHPTPRPLDFFIQDLPLAELADRNVEQFLHLR